MRTRLRSTVRRVLASVTLAALALSLARPPLAAGVATPRDCPLAPAGGMQGPAQVNAIPDGACEHIDAGPCVVALGCLTAAPAIALVPAVLVVPNRLILIGTRPAPPFGDLFRTGPPTPPPNQC